MGVLVENDGDNQEAVVNILLFESEQQNAAMLLPAAKDEFSKILVVGDKTSLLIPLDEQEYRQSRFAACHPQLPEHRVRCRAGNGRLPDRWIHQR